MQCLCPTALVSGLEKDILISNSRTACYHLVCDAFLLCYRLASCSSVVPVIFFLSFKSLILQSHFY